MLLNTLMLRFEVENAHKISTLSPAKEEFAKKRSWSSAAEAAYSKFAFRCSSADAQHISPNFFTLATWKPSRLCSLSASVLQLVLQANVELGLLIHVPAYAVLLIRQKPRVFYHSSVIHLNQGEEFSWLTKPPLRLHSIHSIDFRLMCV